MTQEMLARLKVAINNERLLRRMQRANFEEAVALESTPVVRRYLDLCGIGSAASGIELQSLETVGVDAIGTLLSSIKPDETNKIYVFLGTYMYGKDGIKAPNMDGEYRKYLDIEQAEPFLLPISQCAKFEKENLVIKAPVGEVRQDFVNEALESGQESAYVFVKNKYGKK